MVRVQKYDTQHFNGSYTLEAKQLRKLHDERAVLQDRRSAQCRVPDIVVDDEEFTARRVFPPQAKIRID